MFHDFRNFIEMRKSIILFFFPYCASLPIQAQIEGGRLNSLFLCDNGTVKASGNNSFYQLADSNLIDGSTPVSISNLTGVINVAAGGTYLMALKNDSTVWIWGDTGGNYIAIPAKVPSLNGITALAAGLPLGYGHKLALKNNGTVWGWGSNSDGQLGDGSTMVNRSTPVQAMITNVISIAAGESHSLALRSDSTVWAWGDNFFGQTGDTTGILDSIPMQVSNLTNITAIATGYFHSMALRDDGTVWAWGMNFSGQLGDSSVINQSLPVQAIGLSNIVGIAAGESHSLALRSDSTVWAWGANFVGSLGDSTNIDRPVAIQVPGLSSIVAIAAGYEHSVALQDDGTVWAWGFNMMGELGDGSLTNKNYPQKIMNLKTCVVFSSISEIKIPEKITVYPNPFSKSAILKFPSPVKNNTMMVFYNIFGKAVKKINITGQITEFQNDYLLPGLYFYEVNDQHSILYSGKIIIQ